MEVIVSIFAVLVALGCLVALFSGKFKKKDGDDTDS
jgi:hypothetical protein